MSVKQKNKLIPKLRFPEFKDSGEWEKDKVVNLIKTITPPKKLKTKDYLEEGRFPIIDQSQSYFCGWTNDTRAIISENLPLIVFGDHTCILKIIQEPFAQGADGIKIFKSKEEVTSEFLFHFLKHNGVNQENYKRHFSKLKEKTIFFPKIETGEQQKIASFLSNLDELIDAHKQKLELLKRHKKGLMQNLFPQEGEKVPKYRFPEFRDSGEWVETNILEIASMKARIGWQNLRREEHLDSGDYYLVTGTNFTDGLIDWENSKYVSYERFIQDENIILQDGDILITKDGSIGKLAYVENIGKKKATLNNGTFRIRPKKGHKKFIFYTFLSSRFKNYLNKLTAGSSVTHLYQKDFINYKIAMPLKHKEQQKIASCLSSVDEIITAEAEKIEQLEKHKKGLMQGLFPEIN